MNLYRNLGMPSQGDRCEFRHSDAALKNSRPCAYWMQGTCTRRDCSFMHMVSVNTARVIVSFLMSFYFQGEVEAIELASAPFGTLFISLCCCLGIKDSGCPRNGCHGKYVFRGNGKPALRNGLDGRNDARTDAFGGC